MVTATPAASYVGRFAPSPSGPLHDGSLVAAMASYLDARAHNGQWLVRIEDIDTPRVAPGADRIILGQLQALGMHWDAAPVWQSARLSHYQAVFESLKTHGQVYGCGCTRAEIGHSAYPGTCKQGVPPGREIRAWRWRVPAGMVYFEDRWMGPRQQDVAREVGDFIIRRADGLFAYQFVVVIDDILQGITDVVRGADLLDSTPRQHLLMRQLGGHPPRMLHVPLVMDENGNKLSKQNHASALDTLQPLRSLRHAWQHLGMSELPHAAGIDAFWQNATAQWAAKLNISQRA